MPINNNLLRDLIENNRINESIALLNEFLEYGDLLNHEKILYSRIKELIEKGKSKEALHLL